MDISNSTGGSTGYRVMGSGAAPCPPKAESSPLEEECVVEELSLEEKSGPQAESSQQEGVAFKQAVLREGELKPNTYVTVKIPSSQACTVEFHRNKKTTHRYSVKGRNEELLLALIPNGDGTPKALVCSKSKV